ncbi:MAG: nitronate monooxygenase [Acidimicrobiia bacterium]|nr:nitronate monooxygenase [Acidimicrobiia bacterium]
MARTRVGGSHDHWGPAAGGRAGERTASKGAARARPGPAGRLPGAVDLVGLVGGVSHACKLRNAFATYTGVKTVTRVRARLSSATHDGVAPAVVDSFRGVLQGAQVPSCRRLRAGPRRDAAAGLSLPLAARRLMGRPVERDAPTVRRMVNRVTELLGVDVPIVQAPMGWIARSQLMSGVQMGTRMVSSAESPVHANWKDAIVAAADTGTVFLNRHSKPGLRALRTERTSRLERQDHVDLAEMAGFHQLYFGGDMEAAIPLSGQVAGRIESVEPVASIIESCPLARGLGHAAGAWGTSPRSGSRATSRSGGSRWPGRRS